MHWPQGAPAGFIAGAEWTVPTTPYADAVFPDLDVARTGSLEIEISWTIDASESYSRCVSVRASLGSVRAVCFNAEKVLASCPDAASETRGEARTLWLSESSTLNLKP